jgi:hypothetical protein
VWDPLRKPPTTPVIGNNNPSGMDIVLIDETFDLNQTKNYHLSIQAGLNGYSFSVLDPLRNKYILLKLIPFSREIDIPMFEEKVSDIQGNDEFLNREYNSVYFSFQSPRYTLIPGPLFDKDNLRTYFEFNHVLEETDEIHYNGFKGIDAFNLFVIPSGIAELAGRSFGDVRFFHQTTSLIEHGLISHGGKSPRKTAMVNIYANNIDVIVIQGENLLLCNTFPWKEEKDLVYFILYVYEQLKLEGTETPLYLAGEISRQSHVFEMLKSYIRKITFEKRNEHFVYSYTFNEIDHHRFINLFNLKLCV